MESQNERTVIKQKVNTVLLNCIQKVSKTENKTIYQLNRSYREAEHDLALLEQVGAITKKDMTDTLNKMMIHYVEKGLKMGIYED